MTLLNRPDTGAGNFDIEFRYRQLQWTTGDFSGGFCGLGGIPAQAGYDAGDNTHFFALPGSFSSSVLQLANTSNVRQDTPGLWTMAIRNGKISDGSSSDAPLLPNIVEADGWHFNFNIQLNQRIYIDPLVATGYDFVVNSGPNIESALFPLLAADTNGYDIFGFDSSNNTYDISLGHVNGGDIFHFGSAGVGRFELRGIDIGAGLDPSNTQAFVTGLTFTTAGDVSMTQTPLTVMVPVPEPETYALLLAGLGLIGAVARRTRT
jgi:Nidogen-like/PEP-CTERM motif